MWRAWWTMPGPARLASRMHKAWGRGQSTLLHFPQLMPPELRWVAEKRVRDSEMRTWRSIEPGDVGDVSGFDPIDFIHHHYALDLDAHGVVDVAALAGSSRLSEYVFWIEGWSGAQLERWLAFVADYADACRAYPESQRAVFCVLVQEPSGVQRLPRQDVALTLLSWKGYVDTDDLYAWLVQALAEEEVPRFQRQLRAAVAAEVAAFDPQVAHKLALLDFPVLLDPCDWLKEQASYYGWESRAFQKPSWDYGEVNVVEGEEVVHPVPLALRADYKAVRRRVWQGQVAVLFPFVERQRVNLLTELRSVLRVPFTTEFGNRIVDVNDLEIGHLWYQARGRVCENVEKRIRALKDARHALAHLDVVSADDISRLEELTRIASAPA
jgi:hypothetical protein